MPRTLSLNLTKQGKIVFLHIIYHRNAVLIRPSKPFSFIIELFVVQLKTNVKNCKLKMMLIKITLTIPK